MANGLLADRDLSPVGKHWAFNFVNGQSEVRMRSFRRLDYQIPELIEPWVSGAP